AAGTIGRVLALRDNAFETELAGLAKYGLAVAFHVLVKSDASPGPGQDHLALRPSSGSRLRSSPFSSIRSKAYRKDAFIMVAVADTIERSHAVVITGDCFPVDDAGAR